VIAKECWTRFLSEAFINWTGDTDTQFDRIKKFKSNFNSWVLSNLSTISDKELMISDVDVDVFLCVREIYPSEFEDVICEKLTLELTNRGLLEQGKAGRYKFKFCSEFLKKKLEEVLSLKDSENVWAFAKRFHYYDLSGMKFNNLTIEMFSIFDYGVSFGSSKFFGESKFEAVFGGGVDFSKTEFHALVIFKPLALVQHGEYVFDYATFNEIVDFDVPTNKIVCFDKVTFGKKKIINDRDSWRKLPSLCEDIKSIVVRVFRFVVNFLNRLLKRCRSEDKRSKNDRDSYIFLKNYFRNKGDVTRELEYSFMELEVEYQSVSWINLSKKFPLLLYRWFSLYGSSIFRPFVWIFIFILLSELVQYGCSNFCNKLVSFSWLGSFDVIILNKLSIIFPILNINPEQISNVPDALVSLASIPLLFLVGLGLRNRFKLR
jgi:hypothetical protein